MEPRKINTTSDAAAKLVHDLAKSEKCVYGCADGGKCDLETCWGCRAREVLANAPSPRPETERKAPKVVCLCGSSKWPDVHMQVMMQETLAGRIVIPMGLYGHADFPSGAKTATNDGDEATAIKQMLDHLHFSKIDLADEIYVVNLGGYLGNSTKREVDYALKQGKVVRWHQPEDALTPTRRFAITRRDRRGFWEKIFAACIVFTETS